MWIIHLLGIFSVAAVAPSIPYMCFGLTTDSTHFVAQNSWRMAPVDPRYLNYFARQHAEAPVDCAVNMASLPCSRAATDAMQLAVVRGGCVIDRFRKNSKMNPLLSNQVTRAATRRGRFRSHPDIAQLQSGLAACGKSLPRRPRRCRSCVLL